MLQGEHSAILLTFIKLPFVIKILDLSIFEWPLKTGFTVFSISLVCLTKLSLFLGSGIDTIYLSLYTARSSFEYYRQVYFVHSGLLTGLSASWAVTWVRNWFWMFWFRDTSHGRFTNTGEFSLRIMLTVTKALTLAFLGFTGSASLKDTSSWKRNE